MKSVLRRATPERRELESASLQHGELKIDAGRREVAVGEEEIQLAPKEFDLLWELLDHRGLVLTRDQLLERVWGYTFAGDTRTVDVHVRQLRRKLGDASPIVTVWGVGYKVSRRAQGRRKPPRQPVRSLRYRLPAVFLARTCWSRPSSPPCSRSGSSRTTRATARSRELRRQAAGSRRALPGAGDPERDEARRAPGFAAPILEQATGTRIYYAGVEIFPGEKSGLTQLPLSLLDQDAPRRRPGADLRVHSAGTRPDVLRGRLSVHARRRHRSARSSSRSRRPSCRSGGSPPRSGWRLHPGRRSPSPAGSVWYLSRRMTKPVLALSRAADEVAAGRYDAELPEARVERRDRAPRPSASPRWPASSPRPSERERNFLMVVSHELRTPLTAIRGHVEALREGVVEDPELRERVAAT